MSQDTNVSMTRGEFAHLIYATLLVQPEWFGDVLAAITAAQRDALQQVRLQLGLARNALTNALALAGPGRLTTVMREKLNALIIRDGLLGIDREDDETMASLQAKLRHLCQLDQDFIRRTAAALPVKAASK
jgi:hypothetical protein